jgi:hypothetical protein
MTVSHVFTGDSCDDEDFYVTENSVRRLNWQKGRQDWSRPSKTQAEIDKVTVDSITEVHGRMRKHGWAILRDCTDVLHPKWRFTREQMTYIDKCKSLNPSIYASCNAHLGSHINIHYPFCIFSHSWRPSQTRLCV